MSAPQLPLVAVAPGPRADRAARGRLARRARRLARWGIAWHVVEFAVAVGAGLAASSVALVGFGIDSLIEASAGLVVVWLFAPGRAASPGAERRAQQLIALSFCVLAAFIVIDSTRSLLVGDQANASWVGIGLALVTALSMPLLAHAKRRVGRELGSQATISEGAQNMVCAYLSLALLVGLGANALLGWWWADPLAALAIAAVAAREGIDGWRGRADACCSPVQPPHDVGCRR
jgi:divalent metal cation (Fe/Co/Zn/Cd) transporter